MILKSFFKTLHSLHIPSVFTCCQHHGSKDFQVSTDRYSLVQSLCYNNFIAAPWSNIDKSETEKWEPTNDLWLEPQASVLIKCLTHCCLVPKRKVCYRLKRAVNISFIIIQWFPLFTVGICDCNKWDAGVLEAKSKHKNAAFYL